jgi:L-arabinose transport system substrate-binding protein
MRLVQYPNDNGDAALSQINPSDGAAQSSALSLSGLTRRVLLGVLGLALCACSQNGRPKIGFLVKMPEQGWFINEQKAASRVGQEMGFDVVNLGVQDGEKMLSAMDNLAAQGAQGFVICPPDVRLGPAIVARAQALNLKFVTVDDQLQGPDGKVIESVPHLGMSSSKIGEQVGTTLAEEMQRRGWNPGQTAALRISDNELPTARARTDGASSALLKAGFDSSRIYDSAQRTTDTDGGFNAATPVLSKHPEVTHWLIYAINDETVLGAVRATEQLRIPAENVIGIGINGAAEAYAEFSKNTPTGFYGSMAVSSTMHGRQSAINLFKWIKGGEKPPGNTETGGTLMTRTNWRQVKTQLGLD